MGRFDAFLFVLKYNYYNKWDVARDVTGPFSRAIEWFTDVWVAGWLNFSKDMLGFFILSLAIVPIFTIGLIKGLVYSPIKVIFWSKENRSRLNK